jgi:K+/H+ antiporter YhaU regulatory subunit KhtT
VAYRSQPLPGQGRGEPAPETRFEAGDVVVVLGEPDSLAAAEIRLLQGMK